MSRSAPSARGPDAAFVASERMVPERGSAHAAMPEQ